MPDRRLTKTVHVRHPDDGMQKLVPGQVLPDWAVDLVGDHCLEENESAAMKLLTVNDLGGALLDTAAQILAWVDLDPVRAYDAYAWERQRPAAVRRKKLVSDLTIIAKKDPRWAEREAEIEAGRKAAAIEAAEAEAAEAAEADTVAPVVEDELVSLDEPGTDPTEPANGAEGDGEPVEADDPGVSAAPGDDADAGDPDAPGEDD